MTYFKICGKSATLPRSTLPFLAV